MSAFAESRGQGAGLASAFGKLPLAFESNEGQADPSVRYLARGPGYQVMLTSEGAAVISLKSSIASARRSGEALGPDAAIAMRLASASANMKLSGEAQLASRSNYFRGGDGIAVADVPHFARVRYAGIYPGIDLIYYGNQAQLEYDFVVAPGADPRQIELAFAGAQDIAIAANGDLVLSTAVGELRQAAPQIYQELDGKRIPVEGGYVRLSDRKIGVHVASYDRNRPLVIDPTLSYSTFLGGKGGDGGTAIAVDAQGNAYVAGFTSSSNFPIVNPYDSRIGNADQDVFVTKLNSSGTAIIYSTYIGGSKGYDYATGIAVDAQGNAYVTGQTNGSDFPTSANAYQKAAASGGSFVLKLGPAGNTLVYSTYLLNATQTRIAVDDQFNVYVAGQASAGFATTPGAFQTAMRSPTGSAPFVLKLNAAGSAALYSTFVGGSGTDTFRGLAVDGNGNAYIAGSTSSNDFPLANAFQSNAGGGLDGFVSKLNASGSGVVYSTRFGGALDDGVYAIAVDQNGAAYLAGETYSYDFPIKNAFQPTKAGSHMTDSSQGNGFVAKLSPEGDVLVYSSYLGGEICYPYYCYHPFGPVPQTPGDAAYGIAVDGQGHAYVTGLSNSFTFPLQDSRLPQRTADNVESLFVSKVSSSGAVLVYSSLLYAGVLQGGTSLTGVPYGAGQAIAVDGSGSAYLTLQPNDDFPTTSGAIQTASAGADAAVFKLSTGAVSMTSFTSSANPASQGQPIIFTMSVSGTNGGGSVTLYDGSGSVGFGTVANGVATVTLQLSPGIHVLNAVFRDSTNEADAVPIVQLVNPAPACN
jgi:hypothetical protein